MAVDAKDICRLSHALISVRHRALMAQPQELPKYRR